MKDYKKEKNTFEKTHGNLYRECVIREGKYKVMTKKQSNTFNQELA